MTAKKNAKNRRQMTTHQRLNDNNKNKTSTSTHLNELWVVRRKYNAQAHIHYTLTLN